MAGLRVDKVQVHPIPSRAATFLVCACAQHCHRLLATSLRPWVADKKIGTVVSAHCNCMAGLGEACSHIAAVLFALDATMQAKKSMSCTFLSCSWLPLSFQSVPTSQIQFKQKLSRKIGQSSCDTATGRNFGGKIHGHKKGGKFFGGKNDSR